MPPPIRQQVSSNRTEADTCRQYVVPKLQAAGWESEPHSIAEQRSFTHGRIIVAGTKATRLEREKADYLLRHTPDFMIAVVEATGTSTTMKNISKEKVRRLLIPRHSLPEQEEIVRTLGKVEDQQNRLTRLDLLVSGELNALPRSILNQAFSGQL
jgi:hypothetical protein